MNIFYGPKRRKKFDEEVGYLPPKNNQFALKQPTVETEHKSEYLAEGHRPKRRIERDKPLAS